MRRRAVAALASAGALGALAPGAASARDADLARAHRSLYPAAERAAERAGDGPEAAQDAYDAARDLQEAVRAGGVASPRCRPLAGLLRRYAAGRVRQIEGLDRLSAAEAAAGRRAAERARGGLAGAAGACDGAGGAGVPARLAMSPAGGEAFFGPVVARAPAGAGSARLSVNGRQVAEAPVRSGRARFALAGPPGRRTLRVTFLRGDRRVGAAEARGAWLLPASARRAVPGGRASPELGRALRAALAGGPAYRAAWVQDLSTGGAAGINAGAPFPAASTVKLGLLVGAIARLGSRPERTPLAHDLRAMAGWSSNLATNRLLRRLGGAAVAADGLRRLGARASTFPGEYLAATELQPALPPADDGAPPPRASGRVTTAQDLGRMLFSLHAAAVGTAAARSDTGLTTHQARLALGWLLASEQRGDNASLLAGGVAPGTPIAQKNGWLDDARHAAGIVYAPDGPRIAVLLTYDAGGVPIDAARRIGGRVAAAGD